MARGMARVKMMPRLLALAAAAAALAFAAATTHAQVPGTPQAVVWGANGSVTLNGVASDNIAITAMAGEETFEAQWDANGWFVDVPANTELTFMVGDDGVVADTVMSPTRGGGFKQVSLAAMSAMDGGDLNGGDDTGSMMGGDDGDGDLEGGDTGSMMGTGDDGDLEGDDTGSMMGTGDDGDLEGEDSGSMMGTDDDAMDGDGGSMSQLPVSGTGGVLGQGAGTDAWVFGLSGALVLLGLLGAFAAHRKVGANL